MSSPERKEVSVFNAAAEIRSPVARHAYLDQACGDDTALRGRVEALLRVQDQAEAAFEAAGKARAAALESGEDLFDGRGKTIGCYRLLEVIGEGGCGVVYLAEQREPVKRQVALKVIKPGMDTRQVVARFEAERQALALMDHAHIAKVLDGGATETGRPYFVMELVRGMPITEYCDQACLSARERLELFIPVCQAVQHAHQKGVIHRDLKPSNILVTVNEPDEIGIPKVIDFGVAKAIQQELTDKTVFTQFQQFIGTPAYMSPEQAELTSVDIDTRSDIYSLGVLLYELLAGTPLFDGKLLRASGLEAMRRAIREQPPARPSTRLSGLPGWRSEALIAISNAAALKPSLALRNEAIAALACADLGPPRFGHDIPWSKGHYQDLPTVLDHQFQRAALIAQDGSIHFRRVSDDAELFQITEPRLDPEALGARPVFSPDGRYFALRSETGHVRCWQLEPLCLVFDAACEPSLSSGVGFTPDSQMLLVGEAENTLLGYKLDSNARQLAPRSAGVDAVRPEGDPERTSAALTLHLGCAPGRFVFNTAGAYFAATDGKQIEVWDWSAQRRVAQYTDPDGVTEIALHPDGRHLLSGTERGGTIHLRWDRDVSGYRTLAGHRTFVSGVTLHPRGDLLASRSWDGTTRLWDPSSGAPLLTTSGGIALEFSEDGRQLGFIHAAHRYGVWPVEVSRVFRSLAGASGGRRVGTLDFSPDGRFLVWTEVFQFCVADLRSGRYTKVPAPGVIHARFDAKGEALLLAGSDGLKRWPLTRSPDASFVHLTFQGAPELVGTNRFPLWNCQAIPYDRRQILEYEPYAYTRGSRVLLMDEQGRERVFNDLDPVGILSASLSPDGRWLALGRFNSVVRILDARTGNLLTNLDAAFSAYALFTPDGRWLVTGSSQECCFWGATRWSLARRLERGDSAVIGGHLAFAHHAPMLAVAHSEGAIRLVNWETGDILADLTPPRPQALCAFTFSPDDCTLAAIGKDTVQLWDLAELRRELARMRQDWELPPLPLASCPLGDLVLRYTPDDKP